jgi:hypothetical protein
MKTEPQAEPSPLIRALLDLMSWIRARDEYCFGVTPQRFLEALRERCPDAATAEGFPANANHCGRALNAEKEAIAAAGLRIVSTRHPVIGRAILVGMLKDFPDDTELIAEFEDDKARQKRYRRECKDASVAREVS